MAPRPGRLSEGPVIVPVMDLTPPLALIRTHGALATTPADDGPVPAGRAVGQGVALLGLLAPVAGTRSHSGPLSGAPCPGSTRRRRLPAARSAPCCRPVVLDLGGRQVLDGPAWPRRGIIVR